MPQPQGGLGFAGKVHVCPTRPAFSTGVQRGWRHPNRCVLGSTWTVPNSPWVRSLRSPSPPGSGWTRVPALGGGGHGGGGSESPDEVRRDCQSQRKDERERERESRVARGGYPTRTHPRDQKTLVECSSATRKNRPVSKGETNSTVGRQPFEGNNLNTDSHFVFRDHGAFTGDGKTASMKIWSDVQPSTRDVTAIRLLLCF